MVMLIHQKIIWGLIQLTEVNDVQSHVGVSCGLLLQCRGLEINGMLKGKFVTFWLRPHA